MPDGFGKPLTREDVTYALGISTETLDRLIDLGLFPDAMFITERTKGWVQEDVRSYLYLRGRCGSKTPKTGGKESEKARGE
jgi:predicted DNA-binding transcriptional regulator AlpA